MWILQLLPVEMMMPSQSHALSLCSLPPLYEKRHFIIPRRGGNSKRVSIKGRVCNLDPALENMAMFRIILSYDVRQLKRAHTFFSILQRNGA